MNELPVIGYCVMRKGFWDRQGANIASHQKKMYGVRGLYSRFFIKNFEFRKRITLFAVILSERELSKVDTCKV